MKMYGFWRSLAAYRVRVALKLKGLDCPEEPVNLLAGAQHDPAYLTINPQGAVPALVLDDGVILTQSMAIMEYLDEQWPKPNPLMPVDPQGRARVRSLCHLSISDAHPLAVPRIRKYLSVDLALGEEGTAKWLKHWSDVCLRTFEKRLSSEPETGRYCHGDTLSMADIALASQVIGSTVYFGCSLAHYPVVQAHYEDLAKHDAFASSHPLRQAGAPASV